MISISTSETFRSWVCSIYASLWRFYLSTIRYDRACTSYEWFFLRARWHSISYSNRDTSRNAWNRHSGSLYGLYGDLIHQYEVSLSRILNDILTLEHQWLPDRSDFPSIFHDLDYELDLHRIMSAFHGAFATGVACQQGRSPFRTACSVPFLGLDCAPIVETRFLQLTMSLLR